MKDIGVDISDDYFILHVISNLPEEYDNVVERLEDDINTLDIEELRDKLHVKYEIIMLRKHPCRSNTKNDGKKTALVMSNNGEDETAVMINMGFIFNYALAVAFKSRCPKCGAWGHKIEDCKTKIGDSKSANNNSNYSFNNNSGSSNM